jgi:hypothetical protein
MNKENLALEKACIDYMAFMRSDDYHEDGIDNYQNAIFEAAMVASHGPDIFLEINEIMD